MEDYKSPEKGQLKSKSNIDLDGWITGSRHPQYRISFVAHRWMDGALVLLGLLGWIDVLWARIGLREYSKSGMWEDEIWSWMGEMKDKRVERQEGRGEMR
jgi:hypothetical protein